VQLIAKKVLWFLGLTLALDLLIVGGVANSPPAVRRWFQAHTTVPALFVQPRGSSAVRFRELARTGEVDLLFCGSSHCYRTFDTRIYAAQGLRAFNMGSTAQTPRNTYYLLQRYLPRLRPRVVVFEAYWVVFQRDGTESVLDLCGALPLNRQMVAMALSTGSPLSVHGLLLRLLDSGRRREAAGIPPEDPRDRYVTGGYVERVQAPVSPPDRFEAPDPTLRADQLRYFRRILRLAHDAGAGCLVVVQPLPQEVLEQLPRRRELMAGIRRVADEEEATMIDLNDSLRLSREEYFFDDDHLNVAGVEIVNREVLRELSRWR
jgi:hypothetical protein